MNYIFYYKTYFIKLLFTSLLLLLGTSAFSQFSEEDLKTAFIYQYAQKVNWSNQQNISTFKIGVFKDAPLMVKALKSLATSKKIKGKTITIVELNSTKNIPSNLHILYLDPAKNNKIEAIATQARKNNILLVSDKSKNKEVVMINFLEKRNNSMNFELNRTSIIFAGLEPTKELVLMGGREIDVRKLYRKLENNMAKVRRDMQTQKKLLKQQKEEVNNKKKEVDKLKSEVQEQKDALLEHKAALIEQTQRLDTQEDKLNELVEDILSKEEQLSLKIKDLDEKQSEIKKKEDLLSRQKEEETKQLDKLENLNEQIKDHEKKIAEQSDDLDKKSSTIDTQQNVLYMVLAFVLVTILLLIGIYRGALANKKINNELKQQQAEVVAINKNLKQQGEELQSKNIAITDSIRYAQTIQSAILPTKKYREQLFPKSFVLYRPKDIVSGDFFWMSEKENMQFVACADCTGHGVPGAFMSMIGNNLLNESIAHKEYISPARILNYLNKNIYARLNQSEGKNKDGMDLSICRIEKLTEDKAKVVYSGAKSAIYVIKEGELQVFKGDRRSVGGLFKNKEYSFHDIEIELEKGDKLYLTTDGYIDQSNDEGKRFTSRSFRDLIKEVHHLPLSEQKEAFNNTLDAHQASQVQRDDITLIGIHI